MVLIKNALANIKASKLRVFAAMVWIVLGITSVVIVSSVGNGLEAKIEEASDNSEKRTITIQYYPSNNEAGSFLQPFSHQDIEMISLMAGVEKINTSGETSKKDTMLNTTIYNDTKSSEIILQNYNENDKLIIDTGRDFGYEDEYRKSIIISYQTAMNLFASPKDSIGQTLDIDGTIFEIVGVTAKQKESKKDDYEFYKSFNGCYIPKDAMPTYGVESTFGVTDINVTILPGYDIRETGYMIADELRLKNGEDNGFYSAFNDNNALNELQELQNIISEFTSILTAASLFLGGIGIMNIMYMSVMERRREIGIRRAIGAKPKNILIQFLIEAIVITSLGGIIGIIFGIITSAIVSNILPFKIVPTLSSYLYAVGASMTIGVIFGILPAIKASKMDPIKAIQG